MIAPTNRPWFQVDLRTFEGKMGAFESRLLPYIRTTSKELATTSHKLLQSLTPDTAQGRTDIKKLWEMEESRQGTISRYIIENTYQPQMVIIFIEEGTKPHTIRPRKKTILRWESPGGEEIFARVVRHPGTRPYRMVERVRHYMDAKVNFYVEATFKLIDQLMRG